MRRFLELCALMPAVTIPVLVGAADEPAPFRIEEKENVLCVMHGPRLILSYRHKDVPFKPYVDRLVSPLGVTILRDAPHDHLHHHALMYAITVNGVNFWEEAAAPGAQRHRSFGDRKATADRAVFTHALTWIDPRTKETLLLEDRTIEVTEMASVHATVLTWESSLTAPAGKDAVTLSGAHYHGLGMRFVTSMDTGGEFFNAAGDLGEVFRGTERLGKADWCAYAARAEGKPVTVAMFGDPANARGATLWFTMTQPFAYLSATLNLHAEPLTLPAGAPLKLRYGVVLWDGRVAAAPIDRLYRRWIER